MKTFSFITGFTAACLLFVLLSFGKQNTVVPVTSTTTDSLNRYLKNVEWEMSKREAGEMELLRVALKDLENDDATKDFTTALEILKNTHLRTYRMDHHNQLYEIRNTKAYKTGDRLPDSLMKALGKQDQRISIKTAGIESTVYFEHSIFLENLKSYNLKN